MTQMNQTIQYFVCLPFAQKGVCAAGEYFDGLINQCVPCSEICRPPFKFCKHNCPGLLRVPLVHLITVMAYYVRV